MLIKFYKYKKEINRLKNELNEANEIIKQLNAKLKLTIDKAEQWEAKCKIYEIVRRNL